MQLRSLFKRNAPPHVTIDQVQAALATVLDPEVNRDLVSLNMVKDIAARDGVVSFTVMLREAGSPLQVPIERRARKVVAAIKGVTDVRISFETSPRSILRETTQLENLEIKHFVAVASGKGGVGKSMVAVNLAAGLAKLGHRVGILDGDIHGPNVPLMFGIPNEQPIAFGDKVYPPQAHGVSVMSMGLLVPSDVPVIWRGPMLHQAVRQLLRDVLWGQLDYLIIDLPPGTGDVQLTLLQSLPLNGAVLVTTPQDVALSDVIKSAEMFKQLDVPIIGLVENMSFYQLADGTRDYVFGEGGGVRLAARMGTPLLAQVPLNGVVRSCGDAGTPVVLAQPNSAAGQALSLIAERVVKRVA
ncbi:MAG: ATP-binding protein, partial [Chloroflexi bacterium]|nr:ATP-binding protein [Chloroflexota bacterium]